MNSKLHHSPTLFAALAVLIVFYSLIVAGCPTSKPDAIREAAKASYRLPGVTNDLIATVEDGVAKNIITVDQARQFGHYLNLMSTAEVGYVQAVKAAETYYRKTGTMPADQMSKLKILFDQGIVGPFVQVLELFKVLTGPQAALLSAAIAAVRLVLTTIGGGFGSSLLHLISAAEPNGSGRLGVHNPRLEFV